MTHDDLIVLDVDHAGASHRAMTLAALAREGVPDAAVLPALRRVLCAAVDAAAEEARGAWLTSGPGQALEYREVQAQARAALATPETATAAAYPMLAASLGLDRDPTTDAPATDVLGVARAVARAASAWGEAGAEIRRIRLRGKAGVEAAGTVAAALAVHRAIVWPTP